MPLLLLCGQNFCPNPEILPAFVFEGLKAGRAKSTEDKIRQEQMMGYLNTNE